MKKILFIIIATVFWTGAKADEGMWMLPLVNKLKMKEMQGMGLRLDANQIYSNESVSLKDAVVIFGGGCTGVIVSPSGLVFTNHHCGYDAIQQHSSVKDNYLKDGFTAKTLEDEIPTPGLSVTFLVSIEDFTDRILSQVKGLEGYQREKAVDSISNIYVEKAEKDTDYTAEMTPFFGGNEYYLFIYERFNDVRFAYAPPSSIGKFGGDTDNWMYPRHTGDFSVFRVYASPDGKPAEYSPDNVPYSPKRFAKISTKGYKTGDFAFILGNPGSTDRYQTSFGVADRMNVGNKARIEMRGAKQDVWRKFMRADEAINIAYASKYAGSSNYWKNSIGMNDAIEKLDVLGQKRKEEAAFQQWADATPERKAIYGDVLKNIEQAYENIYPYKKVLYYLSESLYRGVELPYIANKIDRMIMADRPKDEVLAVAKTALQDYYPQVDKATMVALLKAYRDALLKVYPNAVPESALPQFYRTIDKKYKGNYTKFVDKLFKKTVFCNIEKLQKALDKKKYNFEKDPALLFYNDVRNKALSLQKKEGFEENLLVLDKNERLYQKGLKEIAKSTNVSLYPDANFTMRMTYGTVQGYDPKDAVTYNFFTTTDGILEKEKPGDHEFDVDKRLKSAIVNRDFKGYSDENSGKMQVDFLTNNDITGGNSGSPVFDGNGDLIGLAFDGNWEAMSGDIVFEPNLQRCINVDIRYVLFVMDKVGKADRLLDELTILN